MKCPPVYCVGGQQAYMMMMMMMIGQNLMNAESERVATYHHWRCDVVGSTLAFGSIGHGFESEHCLFSHQFLA